MTNATTQKRQPTRQSSKASLRREARQKHGGKGKGKRNNSAATVERAKLVALSRQAKSRGDYLGAKAMEEGDEGRALFYALAGVNDLLIDMYQANTGAAAFKTYLQWQEEGYSVIKGEKAYRVWGSPQRAKYASAESPDTQAPSQTDDDGGTSATYKLWPMCCLFSDLQVQPTTAEAV